MAAIQCFRLGLKFVPERDTRTLLAFMSLMNAVTADVDADAPASVLEASRAKRKQANAQA